MKSKTIKGSDFRVIHQGFDDVYSLECTKKNDSVWCKVGDSCAPSDKMCSSLCPRPSCRHDGCCTGRWDWGGDKAE